MKRWEFFTGWGSALQAAPALKFGPAADLASDFGMLVACAPELSH
jgi:hypothetical protein